MTTTWVRPILAVVIALAWIQPAQAEDPLTIPPDAVLPDGGRYHGDIRDARFHGEGRIEWPNGSRYEGMFIEGLAEGEGRYEFPDGTVYEGEFKDGMLHGQGKVTHASGEVYAGRFENDTIVHGEYRDGHGNTYEGEFEYWQIQGEGIYTMANGDVFRGTFERGQLQGEGEHESPSGSHYEGAFRDWSYHGEGTLTQPNGDRYVGEFFAGYRHGKGRSIRAENVETQEGIWAWGDYKGPEGKADERRAAAIERALYRQPALLDSALEGLAPGQPGEIELYFIGVAPYGGQDVFRKEIDFVANQFAEHYDTAERSVILGNHPDTLDARPLATRTSLERTLSRVSEAMNKEDLLFLYVTTHGSEDHRLAIEQPGIDLPDLSAEALTALIDDTAAKWKIVAISACYSGGYLPALEHTDTLVMTASRSDRPSFGCDNDSEMTYFGDAYFRQALPLAASFPDAFERARTFVHMREAATGIEAHSEPQIALGDALAAHLENWRQGRAVTEP